MPEFVAVCVPEFVAVCAPELALLSDPGFLVCPALVVSGPEVAQVGVFGAPCEVAGVDKDIVVETLTARGTGPLGSESPGAASS